MALAVFLLNTVELMAQVSIGGYNVYYGTIHNHCNISDGQGTPTDAYNYAKNTSHLDFFSLADHSGSITATEWTAMQSAANTYNEDGVFAAFWGFEWSSSGNYGHVAVLNTTDYCTTGSPTSDFEALCTWLNSRNCVAFFNHPGRENAGNIEFNHFSTTPSSKIVGMELWNKLDPFTDYYYNDGYYANDGNKGYFDEALIRSWKIGASGSEDNHVGTWGNYCEYKMAVLANAKTRTDIYAAFQARRFYSTLDRNIGLSFKINGNEMGSTLSAGTYGMQIQAVDGNGEIFSTIRLIKNGVVINTWNPNSATPNITQDLTLVNGEYYYVVVTQADNDEAISSPIWCEGSNILPSVTLTSPANNATFSEPATVSLAANASDDDGSVSKVEFFQGSVKLGEDVSSPYTLDWTGVLGGSYTLTAIATDNLGAQSTSSPVTIYVSQQGYFAASSSIATGTDDAEEGATGTMYITSTDLELVYDAYNSAGNQTVGLRFLGLGIPANAGIYDAYVQFTTDEVTSTACSLNIQGEASDNSSTFTATALNISSRPKTSALVQWTPAGWNVAGEAGLNQRTPDISDVLQEIVNRPGYTSSSALTVIITGTGARIAEAYEGSATQAAKLYVIYSMPPVANFIGSPTTVLQGNTVQFTDQSTFEPVSWSWIFPGGTPTASTSQNPVVTYNTIGTYSVTLTVTNAAGSNTLTRQDYIQVNVPGYCASQSTNYSQEYINKFTLGTFVNTSAGSTYTDFTSLNIPVQSNKKYTVIITPKFSGSKKQEYFKVWIDYNNDFDFEDQGENVITGTKNGELRASFTTPSGMTGTKRMRVAMKRDAYSSSCETFTYGEVEDYTVNFGSKSSEAETNDEVMNGTGQDGLKIYPNPASGTLFIDNTTGLRLQLQLYSLHGKLVMQGEVATSHTALDISNIPPGIYIIRTTDGRVTRNQKLLIF